MITKSIKGSQSIGDGHIVEGNIVIDGILLDEDEEHYYLGTADGEITDSLCKTEVVRVFLTKHDLAVMEFDDDDNGVRQ